MNAEDNPPIERFPGRPGRSYSPLVKAAPLIYTAGYTGFRPDGSVPDEIEEQLRIIFERAATNLAKAGSSLKHVLLATVYLTDQARDRVKLDEIFGEMFEGAFPARCCVEVKALSDPAKRVEIQFVAVTAGG
ncbi:MAG: reactive intermediate/imine deaminase [Hyphomicrobiales bacterium]|nr:reactive intermediate/imine deaminase [Hyphomicrobiales bacterium]